MAREIRENYIDRHSNLIVLKDFFAACSAKFHESSKKGRSGWRMVSTSELHKMLQRHVEKGDMRDVAIIAMMIWWKEHE